jgi:hypothetical protein
MMTLTPIIPTGIITVAQADRDCHLNTAVKRNAMRTTDWQKLWLGGF